MRPRFVREPSDLPDHDLMLPIEPDRPHSAVCHVRHFVNRGRHVVVAGSLDDEAASATINAIEVAREAASFVARGEPFRLIAYQPVHARSGQPEFHDVSFELGERRLAAHDLAALDGRRIPLPSFRAIDHRTVERIVGRPVLRYPYGAYTRAIAEAMVGQPAVRMQDLLDELHLGCPAHGRSAGGEYCSQHQPVCYSALHQARRRWCTPFRPRRQGRGGAYLGERAMQAKSRIWFEPEPGWGRTAVPVFRLFDEGVAWDGSNCLEAAIAVLADFLGFLPGRELRSRFGEDIVSKLRGDFVLTVEQVEAWYATAHAEHERGLVVVAGPDSTRDSTSGGAWSIAFSATEELLQRGFDVYDPGRNAECTAWHGDETRGLLHGSLLGALRTCNAIVLPLATNDWSFSVELSAAVSFAAAHGQVPVIVACDDIDAALTSSQVYGWEWLGFRFVTIDRYRLYGAAGEAVEAVHALCSAYEGMEALARGTTRR
jgi:hypothetical protein